MTFRDKSANVTLNNANEEIMRTKYARSDPRNPDPKGDFAYRSRLEVEIDALKNELSLRAHGETRAHQRVGMLNKEVAALKAENEQLRKDAGRYRFLREQNESPVDEDGEDSFYVGVECLFKDGGWVGADLDSVIDSAIKDFSTTTKEEECDS